MNTGKLSRTTMVSFASSTLDLKKLLIGFSSHCVPRLKSSKLRRNARQLARKEVKTFSDKIKQQRRASRGYAASDCSSDEDSGLNTSYFKSKIHQQRRQSRGYTRMHATSGSVSDLEDITLVDSD